MALTLKDVTVVVGTSVSFAYVHLNPTPKPRNPKPEIRNPEPETRNPRTETRNPKFETQNLSPKAATRYGTASSLVYAGSDRFTSTATLVFTMPESPVGAKTTDVTLYAKFSSLERAVTLQFLYYKAISGRAVATITPTSIRKSETGGDSHTPLSLGVSGVKKTLYFVTHALCNTMYALYHH